MKKGRLFRHVRLRNKMLLIYIVSVLVPVILTNVIFYQITTNNVKKQKLRDMSLAIQQMRDELKTQIDAVAGISSVLYNDSILNEYLDELYENQSDYVIQYHAYITDILEKYAPVYHSIQNITVYTDNNTIIYGGHVLPIDSIDPRAAWYVDLQRSRTTNPIIAGEGTKDGATIAIVRRMSSAVESGHFDKIIKIDLDPALFRQTLRNVTLEGSVYLFDGEKVQYAYPDQAGAAEHAFDASARGAIRFEEAFASQYLSSWRIVGEFQERVVLEDVRKSREFVLYLALPNIVIPTLIIVLFTRSLNRRLSRILRHMKRVKNHSFETIDKEEANDEIGQLTSEFNRMTLQIKSLIHDVYIADIQKKELLIERNQSQLHALQSQINPHFLFNSLETIRMRSLMKKEEETARIIHSMAKIFRKSLAWGKDWVTIRDELDLVACFLEIQKYRFGDKLDYRIEADESLLGLTIPKMTLQPLVENASIHGIEKLKEGGLIVIAVGKTEEGLVFTVRDNGAGIPPAKLDAILSELEHGEDMGESVGIKNVYYRLKLYYKDKAGFEVSSEVGGGTTFRIVVKEDMEEEALGGTAR